jgi:hypothetical protein
MMRVWASGAALGAVKVSLGIVAMAVLVACNRPTAEPRLARATMLHEASLSPRADGLTVEARKQLAELRATTAPYRELDAAKAAGYLEITGCMSHPVNGGLGMLYGLTSRFDGKPQPNAPEILVYAPDERGRLRLVAAEFAVPFDAWKSDNPPELFGQQFHRNRLFGLWVLQAWIGKANPSGMFAEYNPLVVCDDA